MNAVSAVLENHEILQARSVELTRSASQGTAGKGVKYICDRCTYICSSQSWPRDNSLFTLAVSWKMQEQVTDVRCNYPAINTRACNLECNWHIALSGL